MFVYTIVIWYTWQTKCIDADEKGRISSIQFNLIAVYASSKQYSRVSF